MLFFLANLLFERRTTV